jgi:hypothetical protein
MAAAQGASEAEKIARERRVIEAAGEVQKLIQGDTRTLLT